MGVIAFIFGYILKFWFNLVGNYGWALVLFSLTIKVVLFPLTLKQHKSTKQMQELQPKLNELQEKYKDDQQKMSIEYQKFMKENKYNPFGGCLLMILQLFVLLGVLYVVTNPMRYMDKLNDQEIDLALKEAIISQEYSGDTVAFTKFENEFVNSNSGDDKYKKVLEQLDSDDVEAKFIAMYKFDNRYHELKILNEKYDLNFLGIDLGDITMNNPSDIRLWIFPVLTTIFYYLSLWMVSRNQKKNTQKMKDADGNEIEMPNMMMMNMTMPLLSGWISASVPQGMGLYWFMNSFLQVIIQFFTDKFLRSKDNNNKNDVVIEAKNLEVENNENLDDINAESTDNTIKNESNKKKNQGKNKNKKKKK